MRVHCCSIHSSQEIKQPGHPSTDKWIMNVLLLQSGILFRCQGNVKFTGQWMELEMIMLSKVTHT